MLDRREDAGAGDVRAVADLERDGRAALVQCLEAGARPDEDVAPDRDPPLALEAHGRLEQLPRPKDANAPATRASRTCAATPGRTNQCRPSGCGQQASQRAHVSMIGSAWSGVRSPFVGDPRSDLAIGLAGVPVRPIEVEVEEADH